MKIVRYLTACVALWFIFQFFHALSPMNEKLLFILGLISLLVLLSLAHTFSKRRNGDKLRDLGKSDDGIDIEDWIAPPPFAGIGRIVDGLVGILAAFGPPVLLSVWRHEPITWDASFTGSHFLAMLFGVALYLTARTWLWRRLTR